MKGQAGKYSYPCFPHPVYCSSRIVHPSLMFNMCTVRLVNSTPVFKSETSGRVGPGISTCEVGSTFQASRATWKRLEILSRLVVDLVWQVGRLYNINPTSNTSGRLQPLLCMPPPLLCTPSQQPASPSQQALGRREMLFDFQFELYVYIWLL
jgi:hypothetical protein